jgi:UPF0716 family protein affecting phage T7 exclusion
MAISACLALAGIIMGARLNIYALLACCLALAGASLFSSFSGDLAQSAITLMLGLLCLQCGFWSGLIGSVLLFPTKQRHYSKLANLDNQITGP